MDEEDAWLGEEDEEVERECCGFVFQYVNRLLLLAVSATSLMAWDSMFNAIMPPGSSDKWNIWHLLLFSLVMCLLLAIMAFYYMRHQTNLAAEAKKALGGDIAEDCEDEGAALIEGTYANLTNAMGYITIQVWLNVFPIPDDFKFWFLTLVFFLVVVVVLGGEVIYRQFEAGTSKDVFGVVNSNILTQGVWILVNLYTPMWRKWSRTVGMQPVDLGVPGAHAGPMLWVGAACFGVSVVYIFWANFIASKCCGINKPVNEDAPLEPVLCDRTQTMIKQACLYTTATLVMQHFNQSSLWKSNVWWWSQVAFFGSAAFIMLCQFLSSHLKCPGNCPDAAKFKADVLNLLTLMLGYVCGHFYTGWIEAALTLVRWWWIPIAIFFQILSLCMEELRATALVRLAAESVAMKLPAE